MPMIFECSTQGPTPENNNKDPYLMINRYNGLVLLVEGVINEYWLKGTTVGYARSYIGDRKPHEMPGQSSAAHIRRDFDPYNGTVTLRNK